MLKFWSVSRMCAVTFSFADVANELIREGLLSELLCVNDSVLMSETIKGLRNKFLKCKETFARKDIKSNYWKTKLLVNGDITKDRLSKNNVHLCGIGSLLINSESVLSVKCGKWIQIRNA